MEITLDDALLIEDRILVPDVIQALSERYGRFKVLNVHGTVTGTGSGEEIGENVAGMGDEFEGGALGVPSYVDVISDEADDDRLVHLLGVTEDGLELVPVQLEDTSPGAAAEVTSSKKFLKHGLIGIFADAHASAIITVHEVGGAVSTFITLGATEAAVWSLTPPGVGAVLPIENIPLYGRADSNEEDTGHTCAFWLNGQSRTVVNAGTVMGFKYAPTLAAELFATLAKEFEVELKIAIMG